MGEDMGRIRESGIMSISKNCERHVGRGRAAGRSKLNVCLHVVNGQHFRASHKALDVELLYHVAILTAFQCLEIVL